LSGRGFKPLVNLEPIEVGEVLERSRNFRQGDPKS
jgi:hypothetical protein